jgi:hypothetical protein
MEADREEVAELKRLVADISDASSMRAVLGEPDFIVERSRDKHAKQHEEPYEFERWVREYTYASRWQTLCLMVAEKEDGSVSCASFYPERSGR